MATGARAAVFQSERATEWAGLRPHRVRSFPSRHRLSHRQRAFAALAVSATLSATAACGKSSPPPAPAPSSAAEPEIAPYPTSRPVGTVVAVGDTPEGLVVDGSGEAVVALRHPDAIALVPLDGAHNVRRILTPGRARHLRLTTPAGPLLLPGEDTNVLYEVTLPAGRILARYPTLKQPHDAVAAGGKIWVTDELAGKISILGATSRSLRAGIQPGGLDTAGGRVAVADVRGNRLYVYDVKGEKQVAVLPAGAGPTHVVQVGPTMVAVADTRGNEVLLYGLDGTPRLLSRLALPGGPYGLAADPSRHRLWVTLSGRNQVVRVEVNRTSLRATSVRLNTVQQPNSVAVDRSTGDVVVAGATKNGSLQLLGPQ